MATTQPIRDKGQISELVTYYLKRGQYRNHLLIIMGLYTALRIGDILRLRWDDIFDFEKGHLRPSITLTEKKTQKSKNIALHQSVVEALSLYAPTAAKPGGYLIENEKTENAISRIQAFRIIRDAARAVKLPFRVSCHSLRKTFGYHAWKSDVNIAVIMEIYNHSSLAVTRRYLGVTQDDKDAVYLGIELMA